MIPSEFFTFAVIGTVIVLIVTQLVRLRRTSIIQKTLREAISRDSSAIPTLLEGGMEPPPAASRDDRNGLILIAIGLALALFGLIQGDADDMRNMGGAAIFPLLTGAALLIHHFWMKPRA